jgi:hypothetical protein
MYEFMKLNPNENGISDGERSAIINSSVYMISTYWCIDMAVVTAGGHSVMNPDISDKPFDTQSFAITDED